MQLKNFLPELHISNITKIKTLMGSCSLWCYTSVQGQSHSTINQLYCIHNAQRVVLYYACLTVILVIADPDPLDVFRLLESHEWNAISRELHVPFSFREGLIRTGLMYSDDDKLEQVIHKWLESECSPPTWDNLIEVLERLQLKAVLRKVTQFLTTDPVAVRKYNWKRT